MSMAILLGALALPAALLPPAGSGSDAFLLRAAGVQVYECRAAAPAAGFRWSFLNPDVTLYDGPASVATHEAPNRWDATGDRSSVGGITRVAVDAGSDNLPWVRFEATTSADRGLFSGVSDVVRIHTAGGAAPREGCDAAKVGSEIRVPFTADYVFFRRSPTP